MHGEEEEIPIQVQNQDHFNQVLSLAFGEEVDPIWVLSN